MLFSFDVFKFLASCCYNYHVAVPLVTALLALVLFLGQKESHFNESVRNCKARSACGGETLSRPVGLLEKGLVGTEEKRRSAMITVGLLLKSSVPLAPQMVREALMLISKRYPLLRMKPIMKSRNGELNMESFTEVEDQSSVPFKIQEEISADDFVPVFERESEVPFDFNLGVLWRAVLLKEIHVVEEDSYKNAILFTFHHVITDGRSVLVMLEQLLSYLNSLYDGKKVTVESLPLRPPTGYLMRHLCTPSFLDKMFSSAGTLMARLWRSSTRNTNNLYLDKYPPVFTRVPTAPNKTSVVYRKVSFNESTALMKKCKTLKCSVHGAITAAAHIAMAKILQRAGNTETPDDSFCIKSSCNVDLRNECRPKIKKEELVLCVSSFRTEIVVSPDLKCFWDFAQECTRQVGWAYITNQHHKFLKQCNLKLSKETKQSVARASQQDSRLFNLSNLGRLEWSADLNGPYRMTGLPAMVSLQASGPVFVMLTGTNGTNGTSYWSNCYNTRLVTREQAAEFLDLILEVLKDACKT